MKVLNIISRIMDIAFKAIFTLIIITMAIVMWVAAIFGGSVSIKINNPFWDKTEVSE